MKESKSKIKLYKWIGLGTLVGLTSISAFLVPTLVDHFQKPSLKLNHSTNTYNGNKNRIDDFFNSNVLDDYELSGSLSIVGKNSIIGQDNVELTSSERSLITIDQAYNENMFKLNLKSTIIYLLNKNKIKYELDYIKPYYLDSTYPLVGIKLYYGTGSNYYERTFEYRDTRLYGFKKTIQELTIDTYISDINQNPNQFFQLKEEIGKIGDVGIYAKNIKSSDIDLNNEKLKQLRQNNYWVSLSSLSVDKKNPTLLKIKYNISYDDGLVKTYVSNKEVVLGPFDIEQGVDDPASKLKKFIDLNKDWINNLNQYFVYKKPENDENEYSIREAYQKGFISFSSTYSIKNKLEEEGISLEFKTYNQEQEIVKNNPLELSVSNYEFDSTTPMYRLYFTSYENTPIEYTESVLIEGLAQEGDFAKSQEEQKMTAFYNYLVEQNYGLENIFDFASSNTQNPLALSDYFMKDNKVTFSNGKYSIPFELVFSLYEKYTNSLNLYSNPYSKPFDNFSFELKLKDDKNQSITLPKNYSFEGKQYDLDSISKEILEAMNNKKNGDFDFQLDSITNNNSSKNYLISLNVCLGSNQQGTLYTNVEPLEIYVSNFFESKENYNAKILDTLSSSIIQNPTNIQIDVLAKNEVVLKQYIENRKFSELFTNVSVFNLTETIPFPELQSKFELKVNFDYFYSLDKQAIDKIISSNSMDIEIIISIEGVEKFIKVTKNFSDLV